MIETSYNPKQVKEIKEIVNFLNSEFPTNQNERIFAAYHPRGNKGASLDNWHVTCNDMLLYMQNEDLKLCKEAVREKFPKFNIIFCYLHNVTRVILKNSGAILIK